MVFSFGLLNVGQKVLASENLFEYFFSSYIVVLKCRIG